ncbi:unnamed protein product, partial [Staurois parvus]
MGGQKGTVHGKSGGHNTEIRRAQYRGSQEATILRSGGHNTEIRRAQYWFWDAAQAIPGQLSKKSDCPGKSGT